MERTEIQRIGFTYDELNEALAEYASKKGFADIFLQLPRRGWEIETEGGRLTNGGCHSEIVVSLARARPGAAPT